MLAHRGLNSHIIISNNIEAEISKLQEELSPNRVVVFYEDKFLLENAKAVLAESYISESSTKYIVLAALEFHKVSQNSLLKVLEEPPRNIVYIIISPTKSNLLATIRSRLPVKQGEKTQLESECDLDIARLDYAKIFSFLKANARISRVDAKLMLEALYYRATVVDMLILSKAQLENFDKAYRLLELNSKPQSVLALILMGFIDAG